MSSHNHDFPSKISNKIRIHCQKSNIDRFQTMLFCRCKTMILNCHGAISFQKLYYFIESLWRFHIHWKKTKFWRNQLDIQFKQPKIIFLSRFCNIFNKKHIFDSKWQRYLNLINFTKLVQYLPTNWHQNTKWFTNEYQRWITIHSNRSAQGIPCAERCQYRTIQLHSVYV